MNQDAAQLLGYLHRGGAAAYLWINPGKRSIWYELGNAPSVPGGPVNVYFGVHPTAGIPERWEEGRAVPPEKTRSRLTDIAAVACLFAEFDAKDYAGGKPEALAHIESLAVQPTVIVDSGGGYHCYWIFREAFPLDQPADRERARVAQARWVAYVGGDDGAKDLARVLRLPGTFNYKPEYDQARPVTVFRADYSRLYGLPDLESLSKPAELLPTAAGAGGNGRAREEDDGGYWLGKALERAHDGNRNETGSWLAMQLRDNEVADGLGVMLAYQKRVENLGKDRYTEQEARATWKSINTRPAREAARSETARIARGGWSSNGKGAGDDPHEHAPAEPPGWYEEDPAGQALPSSNGTGSPRGVTSRLKFDGRKGKTARFRRNGLVYAVCEEGSSWKLTAAAGKTRFEVTIDPEAPNFNDQAAAIGQALGHDTEEIRRDLAELPAQLAAHPAPETIPPPKDPASLADFAPWVNQRLGERAGRAVKASVTGAICAWLASRGRLLSDTSTGGDTPRPYMLADDGRALPLQDDGLRLKATLAAAGLNPSEPAFAWLREELQTRAMNDAPEVRLARWGQVLPDGTLALSCGPLGYVRANVDGQLTYCENGAGELVFAADASFPAWDWTAQPVNPLTLAAFCPSMTTPAEVPSYTPEVQKRLLETWLCALVAQVKPLPILAALGDKGGGKTTLARSILHAILGADADLTGVTADRRDFVTLAARLPVLGLDNVDGEPPEWLADALAQAATGGRSQTRELYTNNQVSDVRLQAAVLITSRTATFARADVAERTLPVLTGEFADAARQADSDLERSVNEHRDGILVYLASTAVKVLAWRPHAPAGLPARFLDFARVVWSWHKATGQEDLTGPALEAWRAAQALSVSDADPLLMAILDYCPETGIADATATHIIDTLRRAGAEPGNVGKNKAVARRIRELRASLFLAGWILEEDNSGERALFTLRRRVSRYSR